MPNGSYAQATGAPMTPEARAREFTIGFFETAREWSDADFAEVIASIIRAAIAEEREAILKLVENPPESWYVHTSCVYPHDIAAAIRARG